MMTPTHWTSRDAAVIVPPRRRDLVIHEHGGEILVSPADDGSTLHLNRTAADVWMQCDGRRTTRDIATEMTDAYDVEFDDALNDVEELVVWLADAGLLESPPGP